MPDKMKPRKHWKEKLEEAGSFPYDPQSRELAWEKLSGRLRDKPRRRAAAWYWLAADGILFLCATLYFTRRRSRRLPS